jgi:hypothetical protein
MLFNTLLTLLASTTALALPLTERDNTPADLITQLKAANTAVERDTILAKAGGNASFAFDFANPPAAAVVSTPGGKLVAANGETFPFLTDLKTSLAVVNVSPCALILPHLHPRAEEFIIVTQGELFTQFVGETGAPLISNELKTLGSTLFTKGSIHLEFNPTCNPATFVAAFNDNDPGISFVAAGLFELEDQLVIANLGGDAVVSGQDLESIRHAIPAGIAASVESCLKTCGIKPYSKRSLAEVFGK